MDAGSISCAASSSEAAHWLSEGGEVREEGEDDPPLFVREREELLIELFGRCERTNIGIIIAPPTGILFQSFLCYVIIIMFLLPCAAKDRSTIHIAIAGKVES